MIVPPIPKNEQQRLEALRSYQILDTEIEEEFDEITKLTTEFFDVPICTISLIDKDRQWYKSVCGAQIGQNPRDVSICAHVINEPKEVFVIEDMTKDIRFCDNPIVLGPKMRFYAGAPIVDKNGMALGVLCILDRKIRDLNEAQRNRLQSLANMVMRQIESRLINKHLNQYIEMQTKELKSAVGSLKEEITKRKIVENKLEETLSEERRVSELRSQLVHSISHQFKTPLTTISSSAQLIDMLGDSQNKKLGKHLERIMSSVQSMSEMIEDVMYLHKVDFLKLAEDSTEINIGKLIHETFDEVNLESSSRTEIEVEVLEERTEEFPSNAAIVEKLLKILLSNAIKYNAPGSKIHVQYSVTNESFQFNINNKGLPLNSHNIPQVFDLFFRGNNTQEKEGLGIGLTIAKKLIETLNGQIRVESDAENGTTFFFMIPAMEASKKNQHAA